MENAILEVKAAADVKPPQWLATLPVLQPQSLLHLNTADLILHDACVALPWSEQSYQAVRDSVRAFGLLFPLALQADGRVLDGRYRLRAAKELEIQRVPTLIVQTDDPHRFVFEMKASREHLSDKMRAALAVKFQGLLKAKYMAERTRRMNAARLGSDKEAIAAAPRAKRNSRSEATLAFNVGERDFRTMRKLAENRPDLFERVLSESMPPEAAVKQMGKNVEASRVATARAAVVRIDDIKDAALENQIHVGDAEDVMKRIPDGIASLVLFSPPYYGVTGINYEPPLPDRSYDEYLANLRLVLEQSYRVSRRGGRLAIVLDTVSNQDDDRPDRLLPIFEDVSRIARQIGWRYMNDIAWLKEEYSGKKTNFGSLGLCSAPMLCRNHEWVLLFYRETHVLDGDRNLCDLSREEHLAWLGTAWEIKPEVDKYIRRHHPAPFPQELPHRLIKLLTYKRDLVIDPMNGSGTTTAVAATLGRRYIGIDRSAGYCAFARHRAEEAKSRVVTAICPKAKVANIPAITESEVGT
jgi:site-specific DNA-methyltransferase (adenine-specific)